MYYDSSLSVEDRVLNGIDWLDANAPADWRTRIDLDTLALESPESCVLGQVFSGFSNDDGYSDFGYFHALREFGLSRAEQIDYGFDLPDVDNDYVPLSDAWTEALTV